eukprot:TRINITY_DN16206_c0_g2_i2.p1 TRINITY_DN16206_c0_g2~~TRINITY_DN16206_c0_g2_i2.p1  ORF type:complete len:530 (-),score=44.27 TRINITY_DN16206_c0_g2_i2:18-1565(-)
MTDSSQFFVAEADDAKRQRCETMLNFEISSGELLRSTSASYPLRFCGAALRENARWRPPSNVLAEGDGSNPSDDFHPWSRPVAWIHEFWSHSWSAFPGQKVVVLLLEYNGSAAAAVGTLAAFVGSSLFAAGVLPGWTMLSVVDLQTWEYGIWGVLMGVLFFVPTLLCWRSDRQVFLDKISISQVNEEKKLEGVLGIGAFLKASHCLLVLIDSTYLTRLWCVFELAAFSKLMESHPNKVVRFVPLPLGPIFILLFAVHSIYTAKLQNQLRDFTFQASNCYCCTVGHLNPDTGARLMCDREAVKVCIDGWFGNAKSFDGFVQDSLFDTFTRGIGRTGVPFRLVLMGSLPALWAHMDKVAARLRQKAWDRAFDYCLTTVVDFIICWPLVVALACLLTHAARRRFSSSCVDVSISLAIGLACCLFGLVQLFAWSLNVQHGNKATLAVHVLALLILTSWVYRDSGYRRRLEAWSSGRPPPAEIELSGGVPGGGVPADVAPHADVRVAGTGFEPLDEAVIA